ncbi:S-layer homology domain-containing protein [Paenibacillus radicis (ex Xue et al. 2023)]|uniref:non-reducing end alpha-L-arabinofuranosidase n=1 Tax=Paenibacillus radicis (ex Xue et al. 2023) TaxID=2972489 RepID=A0ABT1YPT0_9BACL|nr:S-layer homology domain-containing protein [Paenibacillus radicis (ex Xue et al. 2023)]MCR8634364.1 S-layer homology domain-containing protein [Paenibacillus radicis (ex Xue et al. 2023)]
MQSFNKSVSGFTSLLLFASMFVGGVMTPQAVAAAEASSTKITVEANNVLHSIKPGLFGVNHRYFVNGVGMWDPVTKSVYAEFDKKLADIGLKSLRYPGGTTANLFWWKRSIGPVDQRLNEVNPYLGNGPEKADFGLDEAMRYSEKHGFDTPYVYNVGNGNPQDAAELVEYLNSPADAAHPWAMKRAQNGHPAPYNIKTFELGNEINFYGQNYWMSGQIISQDPAVLALNSNSDLKTAYLYANGGTVKFTQQKTGLIDDWRETDPTDASKSDGKPNQVKYVKYAPIDAGSQVEVSIGNNMYNPATGKNDLWQAQNWTQVSNLAVTGATYSFELDYTTGAIKFGDGTHGNIPAAGKEIKVTYQTTHAGVGEYYARMKAVDPTIKIYSSMDQSYAIAALGNTVPYDGIVIHPYVGIKKEPVVGLSMTTPYDPNNVAKYHYATMLDSEARVREVKEIAHSSATVSGRNIKPIVTEFGQHDGESKTYQENGVTKTALLYEGSLGATLQTANMLMHFIDMDLEYALRHSLIDRWFENKSAVPMALFDTYTFLPSASAYMYKMFTHMSGANQVKSTIDNNPVRTVNIDNQDQNISKLMTVASRTDNDLYMIVLNQDATDAVASAVELSGYKAQSAEVWTLNSDKLEDINTNEKPNTVDIDTSVLAINSNTFNYTYPAHSITAFKFTAAQSTGSHSSSRGGGGASVNTQPSNSISIAAGASGKVSLGDEASVVIPEGALSEAAQISIQKLELTDSLKTDKMKLISPIFEISKNINGNFKNPVTLTLQLDAALLRDNLASIFYYDESAKTWVEIGGTVSGTTITATVDHFTKFAVFAKNKEASKPEDKSKPSESMNWKDIQGHWAQAQIEDGASKGIINGYSDGSFLPDHMITRAEFTLMISRALHLQGKTEKLAFSDANQIPSWALEGVSSAVNAGWITGYEDNTFRPDQPISRAEIAAIVGRALKLSDNNLTKPSFADEADIPSWAKGYVAAATAKGIVNGRSANLFAPNERATRAEVVVTVIRMLQAAPQ